jgi:hypothetical protein
MYDVTPNINQRSCCFVLRYASEEFIGIPPMHIRGLGIKSIDAHQRKREELHRYIGGVNMNSFDTLEELIGNPLMYRRSWKQLMQK